MWNRTAAVAAMLAAVAAGCGSSSNADYSPGANLGGSNSQGSSGGSGGNAGGPVTIANPPTADAATLPMEVKAESDYQSPVATGQIVWSANPTSGRVAYIDAKTFVVQTVQAGDGPTYLAAVPNADPSKPPYEAAIVINVRSHDATLLSRVPNAMLPRTTTFPSTADANSWAMSRSGRWAIAWTDATRIPNIDPTQSFQDIAVLDLTLARPSILLAVGYRPSQVVFSQDETHAFAVTREGISVIDLLGGSQPTVTDNFMLSAPAAPDASAPEAAAIDASAAEAAPIDAASEGSSADGAIDAPAADGPIQNPASDAQVDGGGVEASASHPSGAVGNGIPDVSFTTDGAYALVRQDGAAQITVVSLKDGATTLVALPSAPTDLTLAPDGTFAVAVLRDSSTIAVLPLPGIASAPTSFTTTTIPGEIIGRAIVAEDLTTKQTRVLLFTTAAPVDRLTVLTLQPSP
ncbi:MAG: hypothetical protein M3O46_16410, partial [Myxococcota bacterium]|nr:hypothetical protein [Myxococcota bacterium]